jgi:hypothetical protein
MGGAPGAHAPKTGGARDATSLAAREGLSGPHEGRLVDVTEGGLSPVRRGGLSGF